jgi:hypothetical protein
MRLILLFILVAVFTTNGFAQVGIGTTTPDSSAKLDVTSINSGFLPPRMTTAQRNSIVNPAPGLIIYNTTTNSLEIFAGSGWGTISFSSVHINKLLGGTANDLSLGIVQTNDGGYVVSGWSNSSANGDVTGTSHGSNDYWIVKMDITGNILWNKLIGGSGSDAAYKLELTSDGGTIVVGQSSSSASGDVTGINHGSVDNWVVRLDGVGNIIWNKLIGGNSAESMDGIQQTTDGGFIFAGYSQSSSNGDVTGTNHGQMDYWIVKMDGAGNIVWDKLLGGTGTEQAFSIQQTLDGGYIVAGRSTSSASGDITETNHGSSDYWVIKLDGSGNVVWNRLLGGTGNEQGNSIQQTFDGGYIMAGYSASSASGDVTGTNHGGFDYWIVKLDGAGNIIWNKLLGGSLSDQAFFIRQTFDGGYIVAGWSTSSASGDITGINHGSSDYWIVKLDVLGNITWNKLLGGIGSEQASSVKETLDGGYIVVGWSTSSVNGDVTGTNHGGQDYWIIKLDRNGNLY